MARDFSTPLLGVLSAASSALVAAGVPTGRVELVPGTAEAWDDCCEGQLYVRVVEVFPSAGIGTAFPQFDSAQRGVNTSCSVNLLDVHIALGVIRCAAAIDDQGRSPTPDQVTEDGVEMLSDMSILLDVILCDLKTINGIQQVKLDRWTPKGVNGGCHGGEWGVHLAIDPCVECP